MSVHLEGASGEPAIQVNLGNLYRQETYNEPSFGSVQVLSPVTPEGAADPARPVLYIGSAQVMTGHGPIPVQCEIPASSLREAFEQFPAAIEKAIQEIVARVHEMERERASGIVVPGQGGGRITLT